MEALSKQLGARVATYYMGKAGQIVIHRDSACCHDTLW